MKLTKLLKRMKEVCHSHLQNPKLAKLKIYFFCFVVYERPLAEQMCSETSGDLRRLLTLIVTGVRDTSNEVDCGRAREQAEELFNAGEGQLGTSESTFSKILAHENFKQLKQIFEEYKEVSGNTIEQALKHEMNGDYRQALLAIGK